MNKENPFEFLTRQGTNPDDGQSLNYHRFPYLRQPITDLCHRLTFQKGAQIGATVLSSLRAAWFVLRQKIHTLYLFPTHRAAFRFLYGRFKTIIDHCTDLRNQFQSGVTRGHLTLNGINFYCHGTRSRADLISIPVGAIFLDERDELYRTLDTHDQPWNSIDLARQRVAGQKESWEISLSTPTIEEHGIAADFKLSTRHYFQVPCPRCSFKGELTWPNAVLGIDDEPILARYCCPKCRSPWNGSEREFAIGNGEWVTDDPVSDHHGYHVSQLLSPVVPASRIVRQWQEARGQAGRMQVFQNSVLGLPYLAEGARLEERFIDNALMAGSDRPMSTISSGAVVGIDVGPHWLHVIAAEPMMDGLRIIWAGTLSDWHEVTQCLKHWQTRCFVIDGQPETHAARELVEEFPQGRLCYYRVGPTIFPDRDQSRRILRVSRTASLDAMYHLFRGGKITLPRNLPADFSLQLKAPVRVYRQSSEGGIRALYLDTGQADHYAHALNYCCLAWEQLIGGTSASVELAGGFIT